MEQLKACATRNNSVAGTERLSQFSMRGENKYVFVAGLDVEPFELERLIVSDAQVVVEEEEEEEDEEGNPISEDDGDEQSGYHMIPDEQ